MIIIAFVSVIVVFVFLYVCSRKNQVVEKKKKIKLNRHFFQNNSLLENIYPYLKEKLPPHENIELLNLSFEEKSDNIQDVYLKFYLIQKQSWNVTQQLYELRGEFDKAAETFEIISINDNVHALDVGAIIPETSDKLFNRFSRDRDWETHAKNWKEYKKDWSVSWSNNPILRDWENNFALTQPNN